MHQGDAQPLAQVPHLLPILTAHRPRQHPAQLGDEAERLFVPAAKGVHGHGQEDQPLQSV